MPIIKGDPIIPKGSIGNDVKSDRDMIKTRGMTNSEVNSLIDELCKTRMENSNIVLMDNIINSRVANNYDPIKQEQYEILQDKIAVENDLIASIFEGNTPMTIEEVNELKAKGIYDKYIQIKNKQEDNDIMDDMEAEIRARLKNEDKVTEVISEREETNMDDGSITFQEKTLTSENTETDSNQYIIEIEDISPKVIDLSLNQSSDANEELADVMGELKQTIDNITDVKTISNIIEKNTSEQLSDENYEGMSIEEINDVEPTDLEVSDEAIMETVTEKYPVSNEDAVQLINVINRYKAREKFNVYEALPNSIKKAIDEEAGLKADRSIINFFAKSLINNLVNDTYIDKEIKDFNKELKETLSPMGNIMGNMMDEYNDEVYDKFTTKLIEKADEIQETDNNKAEQLRRIANNFEETLTLHRITSIISRCPSLINKAYKSGRDDWAKINRDYNELIENVEPKPRDLSSCLKGLITIGIPEDYAKALIILVKNTIITSIENGSVEEHVYAYYISNALYSLSFSAIKGKAMNKVKENVEKTVEEIDKYMAPLKSRKTKKKNKKKKG